MTQRSPSGHLAQIFQTYLIWMVLATVTLVVASALDRLFVQQAVQGLATPAATLFLIGLSILLAAFPFWVWLPGLCEEAPLVAALAAGLFGCVAAASLQRPD